MNKFFEHVADTVLAKHTKHGALDLTSLEETLELPYGKLSRALVALGLKVTEEYRRNPKTGFMRPAKIFRAQSRT